MKIVFFSFNRHEPNSSQTCCQSQTVHYYHDLRYIYQSELINVVHLFGGKGEGMRDLTYTFYDQRLMICLKENKMESSNLHIKFQFYSQPPYN